MPGDEHWYPSIDALIRAGKIDHARQELRALSERSVPLERRFRLAELYRRVGLPRSSLRLLYPLVRPGPRSRLRARAPSAAETCEYAAALSRLGAATEAAEMLAPLAAREVPDAIHFLILAHFKLGEPERALPWLERLARLPAASAYQRELARVNRLDALVTLGRFDEAEAVSRELERAPAAEPLLRGIAADLRAQLALWRGRPSEAKRALLAAEAALSGASQSTYGVSVRRTRALLEALGSRGPRARLRAQLRAMRRELVERRLWEPLRDLDLHVAAAARDAGLFARLCFAAGSASSRERVRAEAQRCGVPLPERALESPSADAAPRLRPLRPAAAARAAGATARAYDPVTGFGLAGGRLKPGQLPFRLMRILCSDSYRDFSLFELHGHLFPGSIYRGAGSADLVRQAMRRLRLALKRDRGRFEIREQGGFYRLVSPRGDGWILKCATRDPSPAVSSSKEERIQGYLAALPSIFRERGHGRELAIDEISREVGLSRRQTLVLLSEAVAAGRVIRQGKARATRYRLSPQGLAKT